VSQIAADEVDAVRKKFNVQVLQIKKGKGGRLSFYWQYKDNYSQKYIYKT